MSRLSVMQFVASISPFYTWRRTLRYYCSKFKSNDTLHSEMRFLAEFNNRTTVPETYPK